MSGSARKKGRAKQHYLSFIIAEELHNSQFCAIKSQRTAMCSTTTHRCMEQTGRTLARRYLISTSPNCHGVLELYQVSEI